MAVPYFTVSIHVLTDARYRAVGAAGRGLWLDGMAYCATHRTDGFIPEASVTDHKLAAKLVAAGLWRDVQSGWYCEDYLGEHHNTPKAKIEAKLQHNAQAASAYRERKADKARHRPVIDDSSLLEARSQNVEATSHKPEDNAAAVLAHLQRVMKAGV